MQKVTAILNSNTYWPPLQLNYFKQVILWQRSTATTAEIGATSFLYLALEQSQTPTRISTW